MLAANIPAKTTVPWASAAGASYVRPIPQTSQIGINAGFASYPDGFVPLNADPVASGGVPPFIQDFNGVFRDITSWSRWVQAGGGIATYDAAFQTAIGGYPGGAVVRSASDGSKFWQSQVDSNLTNPDTVPTPAGWLNFFRGVFVGASFTGGVTIAGGLTVASGGATIQGATTLNGATQVNGTLGVSNALTVAAGGATVTGYFTANSGANIVGGLTSTGNAQINGYLGVSGGLGVSAGGINVTGNSQIAGTLNVTQVASFPAGFTAPGGGWAAGTNQITAFGFQNNQLFYLNPANSILTLENPNGAAAAFCYSGTTPGVAAASSRVQQVSSILYGFFYGSGNCGNIYTDSVNTIYGTTSDRRLKTIIGPITGAADRLLSIPFYRVTWNADPDLGEFDSVIADELQPVVPQAVVGEAGAVQAVGTVYMPARTILREGVDRPENLGPDETWVKVGTREGPPIVVDGEEVPGKPIPIGVVRLRRERIFATGVPETDLQDGYRWRSTGTAPVYQNVDYSKLVPLLGAALQEALARIAALEAMITPPA